MHHRFSLVSLSLALLASACSSSSSTGPATDASDHDVTHPSDAGRDGSHPTDASKADATQDAPIVDAVVDAGIGLTCGELVGCDQMCGSSTPCTNACYAKSTLVAQSLFSQFSSCIALACPGPDASTCDMQAATGTCVSSFLTCEQDMTVGRPNPDGGGVVTNKDAGGELNCGELVACASACNSSVDGGLNQCLAVCAFSATPEAIALQGVLNGCLNMACPTTDGGVCDMQGPACAGCQEQAIFAMPNICASQFTACEDDMSNSADAGIHPKSLQDGGVLTTTLGGLVQAASTLLIQDNYLYFTQVTSNAQVQRLELVDGGTPTSFGPQLPTPAGLTIDSNNVYAWSYGTFTGTTSLNNHDGTVVQVPIAGGTPTTLRTNMEVLYDAPYLNSVAVNGNYVYWVEGASGNDGMILRTQIGSSAVSTLYTGREIPEAMTTDGTNVYWADWGTFDATGASNNDATVLQAPAAGGGTVITLATNQNAPSTIVSDGTNVYWANLGRLGASLLPATNSGSIVRAPIGGGSAAVTMAASQAIPISISVSGGHLYWTVYGLSVPGLVMTMPTGGTTPIPIAGGLRNPFSLTLGPSTAYWTNTPSSNGGGTILSLSPLP